MPKHQSGTLQGQVPWDQVLERQPGGAICSPSFPPCLPSPESRRSTQMAWGAFSLEA